MTDIKKRYPNLITIGPFTLDIHPTAELILNAPLKLGSLRFAGSVTETRIALREGAKLIINGRVNMAIGSSIEVQKRSTVILGNVQIINEYSTLSSRVGITIGNGTFIAPYVHIYDTDYHSIYDSKGSLLNPEAPVVIGNNVWIGLGCFITKGVTIGDGSVIAAHSVVNSDIPPNCLAAGTPAEVIKRDIKWHPRYPTK